MSERYVLNLERQPIGWSAQFGCDYPDGEYIGWMQHPSKWCLTRSGAIRWGTRQKAKNNQPAPKFEQVEL